MTNARFYLNDQIPSIGIKAPGGVFTWQEWMSDSIALLGNGSDGANQNLKLISFQTGNTLLDLQLPIEQFQQIHASNSYIFTSEDLPADSNFESFLVKTEVIEPTGKFFEGMQAQACGNIDKAIQAYQAALTSSPNLSRINNLLGLCFRLQNNLPEAEAAYKRAISINPEQAEAYCNLGILYKKSGNVAQAKELFKKALDRDQFYLNALLQYSRLLLEENLEKEELFSSINLRLNSAYSDLPRIQEHFAAVAAKLGLQPQEYIAQARSENGFLSNQKIMTLMKRIENLRLNGAIFAVLQGTQLLLSKVTQTPAEQFFIKWCSKRIQLINETIPSALKPRWDKMLSGLKQLFANIELEATKQPKQEYSPLTHKEFFGQVLLEVLRDGQIHPNEAKFIEKLKTLLKIPEENYQQMLLSVNKFVQSNPMTDASDGAFNPKRLFKNLARAVFRDGKIEPEEKKILMFASKAFGLSGEEANKLLAEAKP